MKRRNHRPRRLAKLCSLFLVCFTVAAVGMTGNASAKATPKVNTLVIGSREDHGVNDKARTMYTVFSRNLYPGYKKNKTIKCIYDSSKKSGTADKVYQGMKDAFQSSGSDDINILYYTGHTSEPTRKEKKAGIGAYGIAVKDGKITYYALADYLTKKFNGKFIVITDTCYAERFVKEGVLALNTNKKQMRFTCLHCNVSNKKSWGTKYTEALYGGTGYSSYKKLPADTNKDGIVTVSEAHAYGMKKVKKSVSLYDHAGLADFPLFQQADLKSGNLPTQTVWLVPDTSSVIEKVLTVQRNPKTLERYITWTTSNKKVLTVNKSYLVPSNKYNLIVEPRKTGAVTLKGYLARKKGNKDLVCQGANVVTLKVKVKKPTIELDKTGVELWTDQTDTLTATVEGPSKTVTWTSSDPSIATVSKKGKITAIKPGDVTIIAASNRKKATCAVRVKDPTIALNKTTDEFFPDETGILIATVTGPSETVKWTSSDPSVATVSEGIITPLKSGTVTITAEANGKTATCEVEVKEPIVWKLDEDGTLTAGGMDVIDESTWSNKNINRDGITKQQVKKVVIKHGITSIGDAAFSGCTNLTSTAIPDSVKNIGYAAFYQCSNLASVTIPKGVTNIGNSAFYKCTSLTSVNIPDSVTSIEDAAFRACSQLTSITIPDSVTSIGDDAFCACTNLTSITIPDSVTSIGGCAFEDCTRLTSIIIPNRVTNIGNYTFHGCTNLTSATIPNSVTSIGSHAFYQCRSLTTITIPDNVRTIGVQAFQSCISLTNVTIPDSVTSIEGYAFCGCTNLTVTVPKSGISIGQNAFSGVKDVIYI